MNSFHLSLLRLSAWLATNKPIPERYSLSAGYEVKYNFTYLGFEEKGVNYSRFLLLEKPRKEGLTGLGWPADASKGVNVSIPFKIIVDPEYDIRRIYGPIEIKYNTLASYIFGETTLKHKREYWKERLAQRVFNRSFRFSAERMDILEKLVDWRRQLLKEGAEGSLSRGRFSHFDFFSLLYSIRAWGLDDRHIYLEELKFVLDSLVASGELSYRDGRYHLEAKALETLSRYEDSRRRHRDQTKQNSRVSLLTLVIAIATALQAFLLWKQA
ncbi:hypothetical protein Ga0609869_000605 [Rhodovulum iodosum]|uniref:Transmembrane protein n=1 Tax=Rhodovulum iodosum TaxID=68291 RepID=A0ABV3XPJ5_9RHOB|nr:hypothetical protein [Rhodovulum robiginosum]RSK31456.1 hypothetical protein EJA01_15065 [Rhodovulum robiginosum]